MKYLFLLLALQTPLCYGQIVQGNNTFYGVHMDDNIEQAERALSQKGTVYHSSESGIYTNFATDSVLAVDFYKERLRIIQVTVPAVPYFNLVKPEFNGQAKQIFKDLIKIYGNDYIKNSRNTHYLWKSEPQIEIELYYYGFNYFEFEIINRTVEREFYLEQLQLPRIATITYDNVNFRASPKLSGKWLGQLNKGDKIQVIDLSETKEYIETMNIRRYWFQFQYDENILGWVYGVFLDSTFDVELSMEGQ